MLYSNIFSGDSKSSVVVHDSKSDIKERTLVICTTTSIALFFVKRTKLAYKFCVVVVLLSGCCCYTRQLTAESGIKITS